MPLANGQPYPTLSNPSNPTNLLPYPTPTQMYESFRKITTLPSAWWWIRYVGQVNLRTSDHEPILHLHVS